MADQQSLTFANAQAALGGENFQAHASEIHGFLTGIICSGFAFEDEGYLKSINDFFNNGETLSKSLKEILKQVYGEIWQTVLDDSFTYNLMLPDDDESLIERGTALSVWVQGFNLGFGLQNKNNIKMSDDVTEIIKDFSDIANLSNELEEDEETEQAYFEISEYVRISSLLCFAELGAKPDIKEHTILH